MSFLTGLAAQLVQWLLEKVGGWLVSMWQRMRKDKVIDETAASSVEPLKAAQTAEEIKKAAEDALRHT